MQAYKLTLAYHGGRFSGWAAQPGLRTVEGTLAHALRIAVGDPGALTVAGRTDAGVHAWGQVAGLRATEAPDTERLRRSLNGLLPHDVAVVRAEQAPDGFDARRAARSRRYCYRVLSRAAPCPFERDRSLWWPRRLDRETLDRCAAALQGRHDFTAFTPTRTDHVRFEREVLEADWRASGEVLEFWIEADSFMRHMVRVLVGTMLELACGAREGDLRALLAGAPRSAAGPTAPAHGLFLAAVTY